MTDKQKRVLKGLLELSQQEKAEIIKEATLYESKTFSEKQSFNESLKRTLGPTSGTPCPCCGR